ncbi:MAG: hypothetical protein EPN97_11660 [Alphaproteobacteria bacterium]|nr:MAG: hypothetical protein EPN97_11660 [Alphaproteobacteria bacterium]
MSDNNNDDTTGILLNAMAWTGLAMLFESGQSAGAKAKPGDTTIKPAGHFTPPYHPPYTPPQNITTQFNAAVSPWADGNMARSIRNISEADSKYPPALEWKKALEVVLLGTPEKAGAEGMKLLTPSATRGKVGFRPGAENSYTPTQLAAVEDAYKEVREDAQRTGLNRDVAKRIMAIALDYRGPEQKAVFDFGKTIVLPLLNRYTQTTEATMGEAACREADRTLNTGGEIWLKRIQKLEARERELQSPGQNSPAPQGPTAKGTVPG